MIYTHNLLLYSKCCCCIVFTASLLASIYGHDLKQSIADQPGTLYSCRFCSWSAEKGKTFFPRPRSRMRIWSRETGSTFPSRVSPLILHTQTESDWLMLTHGLLSFLLLSATASIYTVDCHRFSFEFIRPRNCYRWRSPPRVRTRPAVLQASRVTGATYSGNPTGQLLCASIFSHALLVH